MKKKGSLAKQHARIEKISILGTEVNQAAFGLHFYAKDYFQSAKGILKSKSNFSQSLYFLVLHSIELSLKAFLCYKEFTMLNLAEGKYAHNLKSLLNECEELGIAKIVDFNEHHKKEIVDASDYYQGKVFEYPAIEEALKGYPKCGDLITLMDAANVLITFNEQLCQKSITQEKAAPNAIKMSL